MPVYTDYDLIVKQVSISVNNVEKGPDVFPVDVLPAAPVPILVKSNVIDGESFITSTNIKTLQANISGNSYNNSVLGINVKDSNSPLFEMNNLNIFTYDPSAQPASSLTTQFDLHIADSTGLVPTTPGVGEAVYDSAGTYSWTCPADVTSISAVCVGSGGTGGSTWSSGGGGGGGLGWKNNISVTPGQTYTIVVGATSPTLVSNATSSSAMGNNSYFDSEGLVCGFGAGRGGTDATGTNNGGYGGGYTGDGGGRGGNGGYNGSWNYAGGGAGGYSGRGGDGGVNSSSGDPGQGGGGGAGGWYSSTWGTPGGGGVGIYGEGASGGQVTSSGQGGKGGSGGQDGQPGEPISNGNISRGDIYGGEYGGGGGGSGTSAGGGPGGGGAVRILWGSGRAFPSTDVTQGPTGPYSPYSTNTILTEGFTANIDSNTYSTLGIYYGNEINILTSRDSSYFTLLSPNTISYGISVNDSDIDADYFMKRSATIKTIPDVNTYVPVGAASVVKNFIIKNNDEFGFFDRDDVQTVELLTPDNDPRLEQEPIVIGGVSGPVQSWF